MSKSALMTIPIDQVVFREDLYPRMEKSPATVQKYSADLDVLPPIEVNQRYEIIDGWHRWTAHRKNEAKTISVIVTETKSDTELLELAIARNATHGLQLSAEDKRNMARRIYQGTPEKERNETKDRLAKLLSVSDRTIREWLAQIDADAKEARKKRIFALWLACWTQEQIAEDVGISQGEASKSMPNGTLAEWHKSQQSAAAHDADFEVPIYNVWSFAKKTNTVSHFGNSEQRILDNLLYLYTAPFDVVFDPFAGGGATIDVCKQRLRRYWVSDRKPIVEREHEIRLHDITNGLPRLPWSDVRLTYLDPPYWKQAEGQYSNDETDLANMPLEQFTAALVGLIKDIAKKQTAGAIALLIQPTQWKAEDRHFTDHVLDVAGGVSNKRLRLANRVSVPYSTEQCNPQQVEWAKANKQLLVISRELLIWEFV